MNIPDFPFKDLNQFNRALPDPKNAKDTAIVTFNKGRRFTLTDATGNAHDCRMQDLVRGLKYLVDKTIYFSNKDHQIVREIYEKLINLEKEGNKKLADAKTTDRKTYNRTKLKQRFGNLFYSAKKRMAELEKIGHRFPAITPPLPLKKPSVKSSNSEKKKIEAAEVVNQNEKTLKLLELRKEKREAIILHERQKKQEDAHKQQLLQITEPTMPWSQVQDEIDVEGVRTKASKEFLNKVKGYESGQLTFKNDTYRMISSSVLQFSNSNIASAGSSSREIILLNPERSPKLKEHYKNLVTQLENLKKSNGNKPLNMNQVVPILIRYIRKEVFPSCTTPNLEKEVDQFVASFKSQNEYQISTVDGTKIPIIPLDDFIKRKLGVCRHHALVATYLLDRLASEHGGSLIPMGIAQQTRDNITRLGKNAGAHMWVNFSEANGTKWHIDTLCNVTAKLNEPKQEQILKLIYGDRAIENEKIKTEFALSRAKKLHEKK